MPDDTLGTTGQLLVTQAAAVQYATARALGVEEARRELTTLLIGARRTTAPRADLEGWRVRSRSLQVDITAHVSREPALVTVVHVHVRRLPPRSRADRESWDVHWHGGRVDRGVRLPEPGPGINRAISQNGRHRIVIAREWRDEDPARPLAPCACAMCRA